MTTTSKFLTNAESQWYAMMAEKQKEDEVWRRLTIVFSGHEVPGEGEHKIMQYIREIRDDPNYDPNTAHCMYGQDADLIMLGLSLHEPKVLILRERVDPPQRSKGAKQKRE